MGLRRKLVIGFLAGLFLIGVGGGVMFAEFAAFKLGPEKVIGAESMETSVVRDKLASETDPVYVWLGDVDFSKVVIETDDSLAADDIEFIMNYNGNAIESYLRADAEDNQFYLNYYQKDFYMFNYMDDVLRSIKNKQIPNYRWEYLGKQVIRVAPGTEERLRVQY